MYQLSETGYKNRIYYRRRWRCPFVFPKEQCYNKIQDRTGNIGEYKDNRDFWVRSTFLFKKALTTKIFTFQRLSVLQSDKPIALCLMVYPSIPLNDAFK